MTVSIITPSYGQLDWLRLCIASVADQVAPEEQDAPAAQKIATKPHGNGAVDERSEPQRGGAVRREEDRKLKIGGSSLGGNAFAAQMAESEVHGRTSRAALETQSPISNLRSPAQSPLAIEHIIQDGGTPGIEIFAKGMSQYLKDLYGGEEVDLSDSDPTSRWESGKVEMYEGQNSSACEILHFRTASGYTLRIYKEPDAGMYDALNKGVAKMSGDLWAWLNSDEQYLPGTLTYVAEWFQGHPDADILCGDALLTDEQGNAVSYRRIVRPLWRHTRLVHLASLSCASFYQRSILERGGVFDTSWRSIGDAEWMARMLKAGVIVKACRRLLSTYAFTGQNTSESPLASEEAELWRLAGDAPSPWQERPMIWLHRFRKYMASAYSRRSVSYAIYTPENLNRVLKRSHNLGWYWPSCESKKHRGLT